MGRQTNVSKLATDERFTAEEIRNRISSANRTSKCFYRETFVVTSIRQAFFARKSLSQGCDLSAEPVAFGDECEH